MSSKDEYSINYPNETPENEIWDHLVKSENEMRNCNFINAYNRLKKAARLMQVLQYNTENERIKKKYRLLSGELNKKIIKYIQENQTRPDEY